MPYFSHPMTSSSAVMIFICLIITFSFSRWCWSLPGRKCIYGLPLIGSLFDTTPSQLAPTLIEYARYCGSAFDMFIGFRRITVLIDIHDIKEVLLKRPLTFKRAAQPTAIFNNIGLAHGLFRAEGDVWSKQRRIISPAFSKQNVDHMLHDIWVEAHHFTLTLCEDSKKTEIIDFATRASVYTTSVLGKVAFGFNDNDGSYFYSEQFISDMKQILTYVSARNLSALPDFVWRLFPTSSLHVAAQEAHQRVETCGKEIIEQVRANTSSVHPNSVISQLVKAGSDSKLSNHEILANVLTLFIAGTDTTSITISWTLYYLSMFPSLLESLRKEAQTVTSSMTGMEKLAALKLCSACVYETLRLRGPVAFTAFNTVANNPFQLASGFVIRPSDTIWVALDVPKLDPNVFEYPQSYDPLRWMIEDNEKLDSMHNLFLSFGAGPRICPGRHLALAEATFVIANIVSLLYFEIACPHEEIHRVITLTAAVNKMPIRFTPLTNFTSSD
jgi:cytochrome P450